MSAVDPVRHPGYETRRIRRALFPVVWAGHLAALTLTAVVAPVPLALVFLVIQGFLGGFMAYAFAVTGGVVGGVPAGLACLILAGSQRMSHVRTRLISGGIAGLGGAFALFCLDPLTCRAEDWPIVLAVGTVVGVWGGLVFKPVGEVIDGWIADIFARLDLAEHPEDRRFVSRLDRDGW
jgi:hypothetical protein